MITMFKSRVSTLRARATLFLTVVSIASLAHAQTAQPAAKPVRSPEVIHTGKAPTGYEVTFRYSNPAAKKVLIQGEWYFARTSDLPASQIPTLPDHPFEGQGIEPKDWKPGDFPLIKFDPKNPYTIGGNWPVAEMTKDKDGVWTYSTPLPSGIFTYNFVVDCPDPCTPQMRGNNAASFGISDPSNRPWNENKDGVAEGTKQRNSQVYVPSDPNFGTEDLSWEGPAIHKGKLVHLTYPSPGHLMPKDENYIVVYTPPNYDPARARPYPTLYLDGHSGGNEMNWSTEVPGNNILDNLISTGQIQPMVVVTVNEAGFVGDPVKGAVRTDFYEAHDRDQIDNLIPFIEKHYHVSTSATDRAFAGYSGGGALTNSFMLKHPEAFQYYGEMSMGFAPEYGTLTPTQIAALKGKSIFVGGGWQDPLFVSFESGHTGIAREVSTFAKAGIPIMPDLVNGGHEYSVWRVLFKDFLTRVAFLPQQYATWASK